MSATSKKKQENIIYPAILGRDNDGIYIRFYNEDLTVCYGDDYDEVIKNSQEVLSLYIIGCEEENISIEIPNYEELELKEGEEIVFINLWMPYLRAKNQTVYKKKTLTIPTWLDILASNKNINFSQVLQEGLKKELGLK